MGAPTNTQPELSLSATPEHLQKVATACGGSIAASVLHRVTTFPDRERLIAGLMKSGLESVPAQLLWGGMEEEAPAVFVVYKLLHEAYSSSPFVFRRFITELMQAQPDRFGSVFSRETLWSIVGHHPKGIVPPETAYVGYIKEMLALLNKKGLWYRLGEEIEREAQWIADKLRDDKFRRGVLALRKLQKETGTALTHGNLILFVPAKLNQFCTEIAEQGLSGMLPATDVLDAKLAEIVRDRSKEGRHESVAIDVLFSRKDDYAPQCFILARARASEANRIQYRRQLLLVKFFLLAAFPAYSPDRITVRLAFYLDPERWFKSAPQTEMLFHDAEVVPMPAFWQEIAGTKNGTALILKVRDTAAETLKNSKLMDQIKSHFTRQRVAKEKGTRGPQGSE